MTLHLFGAEGRTDAPEVLAEAEVDCTPAGTAVQLGLIAAEEVPRIVAAKVIADVGAGSGIWGQVARLVAPEAQILGLEKRESEIAGLCQRGDYDRIVHAGFSAEAIRALAGGLKIDVVLSNPPFSVAFNPKAPWWLALRDAGVLAEDAIVALFGLTQAMQGREAVDVLRRWSPALQIRCGGRPEFRPHGGRTWAPIPKRRRVPGGPTHEWRENGGDSREYCLWVWDMRYGHDLRRPAWRTVQAPVLPAELRRWEEGSVPGTYPLDAAMVERVRAEYLAVS